LATSETLFPENRGVLYALQDPNVPPPLGSLQSITTISSYEVIGSGELPVAPPAGTAAGQSSAEDYVMVDAENAPPAGGGHAPAGDGQAGTATGAQQAAPAAVAPPAVPANVGQVAAAVALFSQPHFGGATRAVTTIAKLTKELDVLHDDRYFIIFAVIGFLTALLFCLLLAGGCFACGWMAGGRRSRKLDTLSPAPDAPVVPPPPPQPDRLIWTTKYGTLWHRDRSCQALHSALHLMKREACASCAPVVPAGVAGTPPVPKTD
jgi:hypothetical protein